MEIKEFNSQQETEELLYLSKDLKITPSNLEQTLEELDKIKKTHKHISWECSAVYTLREAEWLARKIKNTPIKVKCRSVIDRNVKQKKLWVTLYYGSEVECKYSSDQQMEIYDDIKKLRKDIIQQGPKENIPNICYNFEKLYDSQKTQINELCKLNFGCLIPLENKTFCSFDEINKTCTFVSMSYKKDGVVEIELVASSGKGLANSCVKNTMEYLKNDPNCKIAFAYAKLNTAMIAIFLKNGFNPIVGVDQGQPNCIYIGADVVCKNLANFCMLIRRFNDSEQTSTQN